MGVIMFGKYFKQKKAVNALISDLRVDTTFNKLPDLPFKYEIKNNFLFIQRTEEPRIIIYNSVANTFKIPSDECYRLNNCRYRKRILQAFIFTYVELVKRNALLEKNTQNHI